MQGWGARRFDPELKQIVREASRALALLDVDRLEELARSCELLNQGHLDRTEMARQARTASHDMAVFAQVLGATRANLDVMSRLRELRQANASYAAPDQEHSPRMASETADGND